jgi:hypothetical protein
MIGSINDNDINDISTIKIARDNRRINKDNKQAQLPIITTTNLRSINNKQDKLLQYLEDSNTDIALLTETWISEVDEHPIGPEILQKFNIFSTPRRDKPGDGTLIAVRKDFAGNCKIIKSSNTQQDGSNTLEITTILARPHRLPRGYSTCIATAVYIPPLPNQATEMIALSQHLARFIDDCPGTPLIFVGGDFNKAKTSNINNQLGTYQINEAPTRKNAVLDLILSNAPKCYTATNHQPIGSSDHQIITTTPSNKTYKQLTKAKSMKLTNKNGNTADIVDHISHIEWDDTINANISPQQKTDDF